MRCVILADIHSNLEAFKAVLQDAQRRGGAEEIWSLGDVVGYGPNPHECIDLLRQHRHLCVAGNHDWAAIGNIDTSDFNPEAAAACQWTAQRLTAEDVEYLRNLPLTLKRDDFTLVHGSPREPIWEYLLNAESARVSFDYFETRFCLIGHSHSPLLFEMKDGDCRLRPLPSQLLLEENQKRLIINCGSVGQPRDGDPRASYAVLDTVQKELLHFRVTYDIEVTQAKMRDSNLPWRLINRLAAGW
jgi:diadenosine tetraphosphatase ApaH/serine/threonine PP2A family protein phosphatase